MKERVCVRPIATLQKYRTRLKADVVTGELDVRKALLAEQRTQSTAMEETEDGAAN